MAHTVNHSNAKVRVKEARRANKKVTYHTFKSNDEAERLTKPTVKAVASVMEREGIVPYDTWLRNLERNLNRLEQGSKTDVRTPIFKHQSRAAVKALFDKLIQREQAKLEYSGLPRVPEGTMLIEEGQKENMGPQSMFLPFSLDGPEKVQAVMSDKRLTDRINRDAYLRALEDVASLLPARSIKPITIQQAVYGMKGDGDEMDGHTNAGYPTFAGRWKTSPEHQDDTTKAVEGYVVGRAQNIVQSAISANTWRDIPLSFHGVTFQRTVSKGKDPFKSKKVKRLVIGMPKEEAIAGKTVEFPMQADLAYKVYNGEARIPMFPGWRPKPQLDKSCQLFLEYCAKHQIVPLSGDISSFDATLPPQVMLDVAHAMSKWMVPEAARLFLAIMHADVENFSLITPTGIVKADKSSVKSGSIYTSVIGCLCNFFIQRYGYHAGYYPLYLQMIMGDDFVVAGPNPDQMSEAFDDFGMSCHPQKQFYEPNMLHFLQMLHVLGFPGGQGSVFRILNNVMNRENEDTHNDVTMTPLAYVYQALARLENASFNPLFEDLVEFVAKGDKYQLGRGLDPSVIVKGAGEYATIAKKGAKYKPWKATGSGIPFDHWAVNRVLRGEKLPPPGKDRWETIWGISYDALTV